MNHLSNLENYKSLLESIEIIAKETAKELIGSKESFHIVKNDRQDIKLSADLNNEVKIRKALAQLNDWPIIGEEQGGDEALTKTDVPYWIIDPLDGTFNYFRNLPINCISIGAFKGLNPLFGVIYDFNRDECFSGATGLGLYINNKLVNPKFANSKDEGILSTGFPIADATDIASIQDFCTTVQSYRKIRMLGSAALSLAYTAVGRCDAYFERNIRLWDIAGGLALVKATGGRISIKACKKTLTYNVFACGNASWIE